MPNDPDYDQDAYLDGCLSVLDRRRRSEPCCVPRKWVTITLAVLVALASLAGMVCFGYALTKAF